MVAAVVEVAAVHARGGLVTVLCGAAFGAASLWGVALTGCSSGDGEGAVPTLPTAPPAPTAPPPTASASAATSSTAGPTLPETTAPAAPTTVPMAVPVVGLSPDGPWRLVDSAPGVAAPGLVYELMPKLWAVIQVEETDESTYPWTLNEADRPIIEAYLQAQLTYFTAATSDPIDLDPGWARSFTGTALDHSWLVARQLEGQFVDLDLGVVYRPEVIGDERTAVTAVIADCVLDGSVFRLPDQSIATGSSPGVAEVARVTRMALIGGEWKISQEFKIEEGCR